MLEEIERKEARMRHKVKNGPSKLDLIRALFLPDGGNPFWVRFHVENGDTYHVRITAVERSDDYSFDCWNLRGTGTGSIKEGLLSLKIDYHTDNRKGSITHL